MTFSSAIEACRVPDERLAGAYEGTSAPYRSWIKTTLALAEAVFPALPSRSETRIETGAAGFGFARTETPAPWAVLGDVLWCLGLGCLLGAARDAVRLALGEGPVRCFFRDIAVFAAAAVLVCGFAAGASAGGLARWYMSAAVLLGAVSWRWAVQPAVHRAAAALAALACRPLRLVHKMLVRPAQMRLQAAQSRLRVCRKAKKSAKIKKSAEKRLQKPSKVLYN